MRAAFTLGICLAASVAQGSFLPKPEVNSTKPATKPVVETAAPKPAAKVETAAAKVETAAPKPAAKVEAAAPKAAAKVETAAPKPAAKVETAAPKAAAKVEAAAPKPAAKVETAAAKPAAKVETAAAKPAAKVETAAAKPAAKPVIVIAKAVEAAPHAALQVERKQGNTEPTAHEHALAAQESADEAARHLERAKAAYEKTKVNVKDILKTGKKIENTADDIKTLYTPDEAAKLKAEGGKEKEPATSPAPTDVDLAALKAREQEEAQRDYFIRVVAQLIFALLYYVLIVRHYPSYRELPPPNSEAKELQGVDEISATCHASLSNLFLSWCCSGPRAAHTFYSVLGFNYWLGCFMTTCFPCCTLWYFNTFTRLNERLGGEKRSVPMGLICAFCCSCCVIAQDAETLDRIHGLETLPWGIKKRGMK